MAIGAEVDLVDQQLLVRLPSVECRLVGVEVDGYDLDIDGVTCTDGIWTIPLDDHLVTPDLAIVKFDYDRRVAMTRVLWPKGGVAQVSETAYQVDDGEP